MAIVGVEHLSAQLSKEIGIYSQEVTAELNKLSQTYAKKLVEITKETAPDGKRKSNKYKDSIKWKKLNESAYGSTYAWYVDSKNSNYRLTHLLVNGHALRDGGRSRANNFLETAVNSISEEYIKKVEEVLKNVK